MGGLLLRLRTWWETADRTQKVVTLFGSAFLVFLLAGTFYFSTRPKMALAYGGLTPSDMGRVVSEIQKLGIEAEYDQLGNVRVPSEKVAEVQAVLARNGVAPTSGHLGTRDLGSISMTTPKSVEEAQLVAVREGEIAKTIEAIAGVQAARVLLNPGKRGSFADEDEPPTASVTLTAAGGDFGTEQAKAVATLVARSVPGLSPKNVTVVGQDGSTLYDGSAEDSFVGKFATKGEAQANEAKRVKRELQPMLDKAFGPGNTLLTCRVEMDFDETKEHRDEVKPHENPIEEESASETMGPGGSAPAGGVAGTGSNIGAPTTPDTGGGSGSYKGSKDAKRFPWDTIRTEKNKAPGTVTSMAIAVLADTKTVKNLGAVESLLKGYLGPKFNANDPNFAVTVTATEFDRKADKAAQDAVASAAGQERMQQIFGILPIAALIVVAFFVLRALGKVAKSTNVMVALPGGGAGAATVALPAGSGASATSEATLRAIAAAKPQDQVVVGEIQEKLDVPLEQIKLMAAERPNVVAMLLKSWMLEDLR
jgi:flagellar M-ring protein FliF